MSTIPIGVDIVRILILIAARSVAAMLLFLLGLFFLFVFLLLRLVCWNNGDRLGLGHNLVTIGEISIRDEAAERK